MTIADDLRPITFDDYVGQARLKEFLQMTALASRKLIQPMDHILLTGPPGVGKTTLAKLVAGINNEEFLSLVMPLTDQDYRTLRGFNGVLFLDELHRGTKKQQEELLDLLEHNILKPPKRPRMDFQWLTVIGGTTEVKKVIPALVSRFMCRPFFSDYSQPEMAAIVAGMARKVGMEMSDADFDVLGRAAGGRPRAASALVQTAHHMQVVAGHPVPAADVLDMARLTIEGLDPDQVNYIHKLYDMDAAVGMQMLRNILSTDEATILDMERMLLGLSLIELTGQGRMLTGAGMKRAVELGCHR